MWVLVHSSGTESRAGPCTVHVASAPTIRLVGRTMSGGQSRPPTQPAWNRSPPSADTRPRGGTLRAASKKGAFGTGGPGAPTRAPGSAATGVGLPGAAAVIVTARSAAIRWRSPSATFTRPASPWNRATALRRRKLCEPNPPFSAPARVSALRHQPMNRDRCIAAARPDAASRCAYSHSPQTGRQRNGSPRAHSGAARARRSSGHFANSSEPRPIAGRFPPPIIGSRGAEAICHLLPGIRREGVQQQQPRATGAIQPEQCRAGARLEGPRRRLRDSELPASEDGSTAARPHIRLRPDDGEVGDLGEDDHVPALALLQAVPAKGAAAQDGGDPGPRLSTEAGSGHPSRGPRARTPGRGGEVAPQRGSLSPRSGRPVVRLRVSKADGFCLVWE